MKTRLPLLGIVIICLALLCACGSVAPAPSEPPAVTLPSEAKPPKTVAPCPGFGELAWQDEALPLLESRDYWTEIVQKGYTFAGYGCSAAYQFDADGGLYLGSYRFNENAQLPWEDVVSVYWDLRNELISRYGLPSSTSIVSGDNPASAPTLQDVIEAGEGTCMDLWPRLSGGDEHTVAVTLELQSSEMICISYLYR